MKTRISLRGTFFIAALLACGTAAADPATVANGADPQQGTKTAELTELWRIGGEDDEIFFGSVAAIQTDSQGNFLLLDSQLSEVQVISPEGEFLRTVSGEGDGPGEVRQPGDMFIMADGTICLLQGFPGRIIKVDSDGTPAGKSNYSQVGGGGGQFAVLNRGFGLPDGILLVGIRMSFSATGASNQTYFLSCCSNEGNEEVVLVEKENAIDYSDFELTEKGMDFIWSRVAVGPKGNIHVAPGRNEYEIRILSPTGGLIRTITRQYEQPPRNSQEKKVAYKIIEAVGAYYPTQPKRIGTEETAPAIAAMWVTADGRLWVQPGDADKSAPEGSWLVLDVFTPDGQFEKQVALTGSFNVQQDALFMQPNGMILVVVGALEAFLNQQAVSSKEEGDETEAQPLEVICYRLET
ncbi:MAG: hypothetical protein KAH56_13275 [Candidatus Krumholzibacteria bacterium]|nr:hypothetical protein [Candidatus Krumholzibacteria bacterium]